MKSNQIKGNLFLAITTLIWGTTFVMQDMAMEVIGPFEFQAVRSLIGGLVLIPAILILDAVRKRNGTYRKMSKEELKLLSFGGIVCGFCLCVASCFQQVGIAYGTSAGKAGFITAMYIIFVPILGLFFKKKVQPLFWICVILAVGGLYLLCVSGGEDTEGITTGDLLMLICAVAFAFQILAIDHFAPKVDCLKLSCIQFFMSGIFSFIPMFLYEGFHIEKIQAAIFPILFAGVLSCGVAYTLQTVGQKYSKPTIASLIMSFESFFAAFTEALIKWRLPSSREIFGFLLMLSAILLSQIQLPVKKKDTAPRSST